MNLCLNILQIVCILLLVCFVVVCIISYFENRRLVVMPYRIKSTKIPKAFHNYHIVQLSDLHNAAFGEKNEKLVQQISKLHPDVILVTGDVIVAKPGKDVIFAADTLNQLTDIAPVYFSLGNHELRAQLYPEEYGDMAQRFFESLNPEICVLQDEMTYLEKEGQQIALYGLNLTSEYYKRFRKTPMSPSYLEGLFGICEENVYHIFMAHNPEYFKEYVAWGADLIFSGHVHGGMVRLPILGGALSPMIRFFPKYDKGLFEDSNKYMILSGGLGNHTFKFRVNNLPEIVSVTLESQMD